MALTVAAADTLRACVCVQTLFYALYSDELIQSYRDQRSQGLGWLPFTGGEASTEVNGLLRNYGKAINPGD